MSDLISGLKLSISAVDWSVAAIMFFNYLSSTGIVSANKILMDRFKFRFAATLTLFHFNFTALILFICAAFQLFTVKKLDIWKSSKLALAGMGFVVFSNLSLQFNSVGFYQVMKHLTVAVVVLLEALVFRKPLVSELWIPLALVVIGCILSGATDFRLNLPGTAFAILNILCTAFYQIWCGTLQKSLNANSIQLQLYTMPLSALFIIPVVPILDDYSLSSPTSVFRFDYTPTTIVWIIISCCLAFCVNISIYMVIGKSSPVTYNILGHFKTCTLLMADFIFFGRNFEWQNFTSLIITLLGVVWYSQASLKLKAQAERKAQQLPISTKSNEEQSA